MDVIDVLCLRGAGVVLPQGSARKAAGWSALTPACSGSARVGRSCVLFCPVFQGGKAALLQVVGFDAAGEDVVIPTMDLEAVVGQSARDFRMSLQVFELRDHVGADERDVESARIAGGDAGREKLPGGLHVAEPFGG